MAWNSPESAVWGFPLPPNTTLLFPTRCGWHSLGNPALAGIHVRPRTCAAWLPSWDTAPSRGVLWYPTLHSHSTAGMRAEDPADDAVQDAFP